MTHIFITPEEIKHLSPLEQLAIYDNLTKSIKEKTNKIKDNIETSSLIDNANFLQALKKYVDKTKKDIISIKAELYNDEVAADLMKNYFTNSVHMVTSLAGQILKM